MDGRVGGINILLVAAVRVVDELDDDARLIINHRHPSSFGPEATLVVFPSVAGDSLLSCLRHKEAQQPGHTTNAYGGVVLAP